MATGQPSVSRISLAKVAQRPAAAAAVMALCGSSSHQAKSRKGEHSCFAAAGTAVQPDQQARALVGTGRHSTSHALMHRTAYEQETRKIILSMDRVKKVSPQGKPILDGVGLGGCC